MIRFALVLLLVAAPAVLHAQDGARRAVRSYPAPLSAPFAPMDSAFLGGAWLADEAASPVVLMRGMDRGRAAWRGALIGALAGGITLGGVALYHCGDVPLNRGVCALAFGAQGAVLGAVAGGIVGALVGGPKKEEVR
jgi:hypothetical protein